MNDVLDFPLTKKMTPGGLQKRISDYTITKQDEKEVRKEERRNARDKAADRRGSIRDVPDVNHPSLSTQK